MATTQWVNVITGERLDKASLATLRRKAHRAYEANTHIFEDEFDALAALGAVPLCDLYGAGDAPATPVPAFAAA